MGGAQEEAEDAETEDQEPRYRVTVGRAASHDICSAFIWHEERQLGLGDKFQDAFDDCVRRIVRRPSANPMVFRDARGVLMKPFKYKVVYLVRNDMIKILSVVHGARDESAWKRRVDEETD